MYKLSLFETQKAIKFIKDTFQNALSKSLNLQRVTGPIVLKQNVGINDDLTGEAKPVKFESQMNGLKGEIPQSLAKWKRLMLQKYDVPLHEGIYVDMNAIRKDEIISHKHSIYVDQWDWELVIKKEERNINVLKKVALKIYECIVYCQKTIYEKYNWPKDRLLPNELKFITSEMLLQMYPNAANAKEREDLAAKEFKAFFLIGIGHKLSNGLPHDNRSPDYDDWDLNGDIIVYDYVHDESLELTSMGIRVDSISLVRQLEIHDCLERLKYDFHINLANDRLPFSIGGGIGQSRLCYFILNKQHIAEVQVSIWPKYAEEQFETKKINVL